MSQRGSTTWRVSAIAVTALCATGCPSPRASSPRDAASDDGRPTDGSLADGSPDAGEETGPCGAPEGPTPQWARRFGGVGREDAVLVAAGGDGALTLVGTFGGTMPVGEDTVTSAGESDAFVLRAASDGVALSAFRFGGASDETARAAVLTSGALAIVGGFEGTLRAGDDVLTSAGREDGYLAVYDAAGSALAVRRMGGIGDDTVTAVAAGPDGGIVAALCVDGEVDLGGGPVGGVEMSNVLAEYDASGVYVTATRLAMGDACATITAVARTPTGETFVVGSFRGTLALEGHTLVSQGGADVFIAALQASGDPRWASGWGGPNEDSAAALAVNTDGELTVTGSYYGGANFGGDDFVAAGVTDVFVARYSSAGTHLWSSSLGGVGVDHAHAVLATGAEEVFVTGIIYGVGPDDQPEPTADSLNVFLCCYDAQGQSHWMETFVGPGGATGTQLAQAPSGELLLAGRFEESFEVGAETLTAAGANDVFLAALELY